MCKIADKPFSALATLKTRKPSFSSCTLASLAAVASTILVTISPEGVPRRQINSAIVKLKIPAFQTSNYRLRLLNLELEIWNPASKFWNSDYNTLLFNERLQTKNFDENNLPETTQI